MQTPKSFEINELFKDTDLPDFIRRVEEELINAVQSDAQSLKIPLNRLLKYRGKRMRPSLVYLVGISLNCESIEKLVKAAASIELMHIASLVHDDIMDDSDVRWGKPTINGLEGSNQALLAGDFLFAKSLAIASGISQKCANELSKAYVEICEGQALEADMLHNINRTEEHYRNTVKGKTVALFSASVNLGAIISGATVETEKRLLEFSEHFGLMFQLLDDLQDIYGDTIKSGKPIGSDVKAGVYTLPVILCPDAAEVDDNKIRKMVRDSGSLRKCMDLIEDYKNNALIATESFSKISHFVTIYHNIAVGQLDLES